jgi:hypothetical protein
MNCYAALREMFTGRGDRGGQEAHGQGRLQWTSSYLMPGHHTHAW